MIRILLALLVVFVVWYVMWKYRQLPEERRKKALTQIGLITLALTLVLLVATGRAHWIFAVIGGLMAMVGRLLPLLRYVPVLRQLLAMMGLGAAADSAAGARRPGGQVQDISREDAAAILGVDVNASENEILEAHKKLMHKIHPDRGGSDVLAAQINAARDVLLEK